MNTRHRVVNRSTLLAAMVVFGLAALWGAPTTAQTAADPAIAYVGGHSGRGQFYYDLTVMNADGSNATVVWSRTQQIVHVSWSTDADGDPTNGQHRTLCIEAVVDNNKKNLYLMDVAVVNGVPQGSNLRLLIDYLVDPNVGDIAVQPAWSPDLDPITPGYQGKIAFVGSTDGGNTGSINLIDMAWNGSTIAPLFGPNSSTVLIDGKNANETLWYPTWSPNASRLAFRATPAAGSAGSALKVVDLTTGGLTTVLSEPASGWFLDLDWSRTSSNVTFRFAGSTEQLYTIDVDAGASSLQQIPAAAYGNQSPTWSPDDRYVVFSGKDSSGGKYMIRRIDLTTGVQSTVASLKGVDLRWPDWKR